MGGAERNLRSVAERKGAVVMPAALAQYIHGDLKDSTNLSPLSFISDGSCSFFLIRTEMGFFKA